MEEKLKDFIQTVLDDPARRSILLVLLEQEGFHADDLSEETEKTL